MKLSRQLVFFSLIAVALGSGVLAHAQTYPTRPVRFIVGPGPDVLARIVGQKLTEGWGHQVVVDQRPGAGGIIAADTVSKSVPDGYTLLLTTGAYTINATLYPKLPYSLERDLAPVALLASISFLVIVNPSVPAKTMQDLVQLARAKPGQLNCAHSGPGTTAHLGCEMLKNTARIDVVSVSYKGTVPAVIDVVSGQSQLMFAVMQGGLPHVQAGKLRAVAVTGSKRAAALPEVPTITEAGYAGADFISWNGVHVRAGTPKAVVARLNSEFNRVLKLPDIQERMAGLGLDAAGGTAEAFGIFVKEDIARWAKVIRDTDVRVE
ncbi:MAG TPA: tripartite tricarboxylate transporter substrate binding protein [Burkholderiales bacterium]|nr:tripartite tricarboxylate transporter substrate binding protein [Burkholderiales bacterium]